MCKLRNWCKETYMGSSYTFSIIGSIASKCFHLTVGMSLAPAPLLLLSLILVFSFVKVSLRFLNFVWQVAAANEEKHFHNTVQCCTAVKLNVKRYISHF